MVDKLSALSSILAHGVRVLRLSFKFHSFFLTSQVALDKLLLLSRIQFSHYKKNECNLTLLELLLGDPSRQGLILNMVPTRCL